MNTMKAVVLHGANDYRVEKTKIPTPEYGEVLVKIHAVAICGSDPRIFSGDSRNNGWPPYYPFIAGHEFAGEVVMLGEGVEKFKLGDRVAGEAHCGCGYCSMCMKGFYNLCLNYGVIDSGHHHYGHYTPGCYAQYQKYNVKSLTWLPANVSYEEGTLVDTAGTAFNALQLCKVEPGSYTVVIGPGPMGLLAMMLAKIMGSQTIVIGRGKRLKVADELGATHCIDFENTVDVVKEVKEKTDGLGAHQVIEAAGAGAFVQAIQMARKGGKVAYISIPSEDIQETAIKTLVMNQITLHGVRANPNCSETIIKLMAQGKLSAKQMITHTFSIDEIDEAFETFIKRKDGAVKVVIHPWEGK